MRLRRLILATLLLAPVVAHAQAPRSAQTAFAAALAENLSSAYAELDALKAQLADAQKQLADAKKPAPADAAKP